MKANELMIFDLVRRKKDNRTMIVVEVGYDENIGAITTDDRFYGDFEDYHETQVEPIPITPEILEKNGFEKLGFDGWEFDYETEGGCLIYEVLWRCDYPKEYHTHLTIKSYSPDFGSFKSFRIDSVHELQHALRLCGIEKEIVL